MDTRPMHIYEALYKRYGEPDWWPAKTPFEVITGAILTQNTVWGNVEKAIDNFPGGPTPEFVLNAKPDELVNIIRPAGSYQRKAACLKAVSEWLGLYGFDISALRREPLDKLLARLLEIKGIGRESADAILLYAFGFTTFVVDAYTVRLCNRYSIEAGKDYEAIKSYFEENLPKCEKIYNNFHALIVTNAKTHCRKKPVCEGCPLENTCEKCAN